MRSRRQKRLVEPTLLQVNWADLTTVLGAVALAAGGGVLFLKGVLGMAAAMRVPKLLVATTLAAFATSSPEFTVSTVAALEGVPEIGLGNALGANVVNIALICGLILLFGPIRVERHELGRDFVFALAVPMLTLWFARDGGISRFEGSLLLAVFMLWLGLLIRSGLAARAARVPPPDSRPWYSLLLGAAGFASLLVAGHLFVSGATGLATAFRVDGYVIGATVVAVGTTLPELVTALLARLRGHHEVGVGLLLGSNLFNGLAIVGTTASIHPISVPLAETAVVLLMGLLSLLLLIPGRAALIGVGRGGLLLLVYALFVVATVVTGRAV